MVENIENISNNVYDRAKLSKEIMMLLGGTIIDIELDPDHYDLAIDMALDRFRQRSSNSVFERFVFIELQPDQQVYYLPHEVQEVRQIMRRGVGTQGTGGGTQIDPFAMAYTNMYLKDSGRQGGFLSFELFHQFQEVAGRLFGREMTFTFDRVTHALKVDRLIRVPEEVVLWVFTYRPDTEILNDMYARPWIRSYAIAQAKLMLGNAYAKFVNIIGPQGGTSLPADALKNEAQAEIDKLEEEIKTFIAGDTPLGLVIG